MPMIELGMPTMMPRRSAIHTMIVARTAIQMMQLEKVKNQHLERSGLRQSGMVNQKATESGRPRNHIV